MPKAKLSQEAEAVIKMWQSQPHVGIEGLKKATERVGLEPAEQLTWALNFANSDLSKFTPGDWLNAQVELAAFKHPEVRALTKGKKSIAVRVTVSSAGRIDGMFPTIEQIVEVHDIWQQKLASYHDKGEMSGQHDGVFTFSVKRDAEGHTTFVQNLNDFLSASLLRFAGLIAEFGDLVRVCPVDRHGCGKWFLASRSDRMYCSTTCVSRHTTAVARGEKAS